jgi:hypothetical protein
MTKFAILRTNKIKTNAQIATAGAHNNRDYNVRNADPNRAFKLIAGSEDPLKAFQDLIKKNDMRIRSNAVRAIELVVSFSPEQKGKLDPKDWVKDNLKFFEEKHGKEAILSAHVHMDEATPHCHFIVCPQVLTKGKMKLNCREFLGGKAKLQKLQTDYAKAMEKHGLERGIKGSKAHHKKVSHLYGQLNRDFESLKKNVDKEMSKIEEPGLLNFKPVFASMKKQLRSLVKKISTQSGRIQSLTKKNKRLETDMAKLREWVKNTEPYLLAKKHEQEISLVKAQKDDLISQMTQSRDSYKKTLESSQARFEAAEKVIKRDRLGHTLDNSLR